MIRAVQNLLLFISIVVIPVHAVAQTMSDKDRKVLDDLNLKYTTDVLLKTIKSGQGKSTSSTVKAVGSEKPSDKWAYIWRKRGSSKSDADCSGALFLLRKDWVDVGTLGCPETTEKATGALISYTNDREAKNKAWSVHGMAGTFVSQYWEPKNYNEYNFTRLAFGAYTALDQTTNSRDKSKDADKVAYGGSLEIGLNGPDGNYFNHILRINGGGVDDQQNMVKSASVTAEYIPTSDFLGYPREIGSLPVRFIFQPTILGQYHSVVGSDKTLAFNGKNDAARLGPQFAIKIVPLKTIDGSEKFFLENFVFLASYHWAHDFVSSKSIKLLSSALTYNLDEEGHIGATVSYSRGQDEDTGVKSNLFRAGLTGKF